MRGLAILRPVNINKIKKINTKIDDALEHKFNVLIQFYLLLITILNTLIIFDKSSLIITRWPFCECQ